MSLNHQALTIPAAADHVNFSVSTLRSYIQAWETSFGPLPKDAKGWTRLVGPLLDVLNEAHELWPTRMSHEQRILHVLEQEPIPRFLRITEAYILCDHSNSLVDAERFVERVTSAALNGFAVSIQELQEARDHDRRQIEKATEEQVDDLRAQLAEISEYLATDLHAVAKAALTIALRMEKVTSYLLEPDDDATDESSPED